MECEKGSKWLMTQLLHPREVRHYKLMNLEASLGALHQAVQEGKGSKIAEKNFMTIYEALQKNPEINLEPFQKTYESLREKYKIK